MKERLYERLDFWKSGELDYLKFIFTFFSGEKVQFLFLVEILEMICKS